MGLSGRKQKQRISADPRNLSWADDAGKFGQAYLSKLGWAPSQGLGVSGDGTTNYIKVAQKLDMSGIGAGKQGDPNGIAWKQNNDFESLLKRLNEGVDETSGADNGTGVETKATAEQTDRADTKEKKRKRRKDTEEDCTKKRKKSRDEQPDLPVVEAPTPKPFVSRPMAHRARLRASKNLSLASTTAISEILGIAPSSSSSGSASPFPAPTPKLTQIDDAPNMERLTTSTKSVNDYFMERLASRDRTSTSTSAGPSTPQKSRTLDEDDAPRRGIGASRLH